MTTALDIIQEAAIQAHRDQMRADGVTPYITHPIAVMEMVRSFGGSEVAQMAALSHDVVEDCSPDMVSAWHDCVQNTLSDQDAKAVFLLVEALTKPGKTPGMNRTDRNRVAATKVLMVAEVLPEVVLVKICDRAHNLSTIHAKGEGFIKVYIGESRALIEALMPIGSRLFPDALQVAQENLAVLENSMGPGL